METFKCSLSVNKSKKVRRDSKEYLLATSTLIVPGILNGSKGPLLYRRKDIAESVKLWNGVPVTLEHPEDNGDFVSANDSGIKEKFGLGFLENPRIKSNGNLVADVLIDINKAKKASPKLVSRIDSGEKVELSTGLFTKNVEVPEGSMYEGDRYTHIATNFEPDHLAILPHSKGACSINDGCGVSVNERKTDYHSPLHEVDDEGEWKGIRNQSYSMDDLRSHLNTKLKEKYPPKKTVGGLVESSGYPWIVDVFSSYVVFNLKGKLYRLGYKKTNSSIELSSSVPQEVVKVTTYKPVVNKTPTRSVRNKRHLKPKNRIRRYLNV